MKKICLMTIFIFSLTILLGQEIKLMDHLLFPRLDSAHWESDCETLNGKYSKIANRCQTCTFTQTKTTRKRFCFNTTKGHVHMDTVLHNFTAEKLIGKWNVINFGLFEITDSIFSNFTKFDRSFKIIYEEKENNGYISFTEKRIKTALKKKGEIPNKNKKYKILDGKFLTTRSLTGYCGATIIGLTKEEYLILDDHTYKTIGEKEKYLVIKTSIRRMILKKK